MTAHALRPGARRATGADHLLCCLILCCLAWTVRPGQADTVDPLRSIAARSYASRTLTAIVDRSALEESRRQPQATPEVGLQPPASRPRPSPRDLAAYDEIIERHSNAQGIDPDLVRAVIQAESSGDAQAVSARGAAGLMQLMPATAAQFGSPNVFDPEQNIASGVRYLRSLLNRYRSVEVALWAYNAGPQAVAAGRMPTETENYVPRVLKLRRYYRSQGGR